jgi:hypothetical protein
MFCPKCGRQQVSEEVNFCSACGAELTSRGGPSTRRIIAMLMHVAVAALAIMGWGPWSGPSYMQVRALILLLSVISFFLLYSSDLKRAFSTLFGQPKDQSVRETLSSSASNTLNQVGTPSGQPALPAKPVNSLGQRVRNTAEMLRPPSITEHTTELLNKDR